MQASLSHSNQPVVVLFAYFFPPENAIGAARPFRFYKYLRRLGYRVYVITASEPEGQVQGPDITYIPDPFLPDAPRGFGWHLEWLLRRMLVAGAIGSQWSYLAWRAGRDLIRRHPGDQVTLLSSFPPLGVNLAAWRLGSTEGVKWIADFRDPVATPAFRALVSPLHAKVFEQAEATAVRRADLVICNTSALAEEWSDLYPEGAAKLRVIWNGFDPEDRLERRLAPVRPHREISHVGNLYADRTIAPLVESLHRLVEARQLPAASFRIRLVGLSQENLLGPPAVVAQAKAAGWLRVEQEFVPRAAALRIIEESEGLVLLQPQSRNQVPGKLFEYLQTGRPVLALLQHGSCTQAILERSGVPFVTVAPDDSSATIDSAVLRYFSLSPTPTGPSAWFEETFNGQDQVAALAALIQSLHTSR